MQMRRCKSRVNFSSTYVKIPALQGLTLTQKQVVIKHRFIRHYLGALRAAF